MTETMPYAKNGPLTDYRSDAVTLGGHKENNGFMHVRIPFEMNSELGCLLGSLENYVQSKGLMYKYLS